MSFPYFQMRTCS